MGIVNPGREVFAGVRVERPARVWDLRLCGQRTVARFFRYEVDRHGWSRSFCHKKDIRKIYALYLICPANNNLSTQIAGYHDYVSRI
jgi:hypothetical protein